MNAYMHQVKMADSLVDTSGAGVARFEEQGNRNGEISVFFHSAADCQAAADLLASLADEMRQHESHTSMEDESNEQPQQA